MTVSLRPMSAESLAAYLVRSKADYIEELVLAGNSREAAQENADTNMDGSFPGGVPAPGHEVFDVMDGGDVVGVLWIAPRDGKDAWWVYDIEIAEGQRRKGYGRATMLRAEQHVRELGGTALGLNVFGHNPNARALYESLGFETRSMQMSKKL